VGYNYSQWRNTFGGVDRVDYFGGVTFATNENQDFTNGVSIGNFININITDQINGDFENYVINDGLYLHEYGHSFQSQIFGLSYLPVVGFSSFISAGTDPRNHDTHWTEIRANRHVARYLRRHYG